MNLELSSTILFPPNTRRRLSVFTLTVTLGLILVISSRCVKVEQDAIDPPTERIILIEPAEPLSVHPDNPRYFTDGSGKAIYLTGSHTWANLQDAGEADPPPEFDYQAYLDFLEANNHNFFRLWVWEQAEGIDHTTNEFWFIPMPYKRTGPGSALDGKPRFDLTKFNQAYFDRMRERIIDAGDRGMYVSIMLFNGFSVGDKPTGSGNPWPGHPFNGGNNINGIDGDPNEDGNGYEVHTLDIPGIVDLQEAYIKNVINTVNDLNNVLYEICNECEGGSKELTWQVHMIDFIHDYEAEMPKQHPVGMTVAYPNGNNDDLFNSPADWISPNGDGGYKDDPPEADGTKVIVVDTDHLWGIGGDRVWLWKSFMQGMNPIYMDCYSTLYCPDLDPDDPTRLSVIRNMGSIRDYATRVDLASMIPHGELASSGYALANPVSTGADYLIYLPSGDSVTVDLSGSPGKLFVEWFNPATGEAVDGGTTTGGVEGRLFYTPPGFNEDAVLYIFQEKPPVPPTPPTPTTPITPPIMTERIYLPVVVCPNAIQGTSNSRNQTVEPAK